MLIVFLLLKISARHLDFTREEVYPWEADSARCLLQNKTWQISDHSQFQALDRRLPILSLYFTG